MGATCTEQGGANANEDSFLHNLTLKCKVTYYSINTQRRVVFLAKNHGWETKKVEYRFYFELQVFMTIAELSSIDVEMLERQMRETGMFIKSVI